MATRTRRPDHDLAGIPWWTSLLGVSARVIPGPEHGSALVVLATMAGGIVYPLDEDAGARNTPGVRAVPLATSAH